MNKIYQKISLLAFLLFVSNIVLAQIPAGYYNNVKGKTEWNLKTTLSEIIKDPSVTSYNGLWTSFRETDAKPNGKVWDMYTDIPDGTLNGNPSHIFTFGSPDQCGSNNAYEGGCYNREHSFPKSWWGGSTSAKMHNDIFHLVPTDAYVNNKRNNYPFGEVGSPTYTSSNGSKLGTGTLASGYTGTVFEPIDAYKGDFARTYFYMATCYEDQIAAWQNLTIESKSLLNGDKNQAYQEWMVNLLLKWHRQDPVSEKEINRNNAAQKVQGNRNPFIDYPQLAEHIWGNKKTEAFYLNIITGIEQLAADAGYTLFYANGELQVLDNTTEGVIEIYTITGKLLTKQRVEVGNNNIVVPPNNFLIVRLNGISSKLSTY